MTDEMLTYSQTDFPSRSVLAALAAPMEPPASSLLKKTPPPHGLRLWLEEATALIERQGLEIMGWNRKTGALIAHLRQAYNALGRAEQNITALQRRITLLETLSTTDDLTGLKNRRGFREGFEREIESCTRTGQRGLLVMIDLDNFKTINDTHGHDAGDSVLKLVARTLAGEIRKTDLAARLGGDEFVLILSNTDKNKAVARAQAISWQLNDLCLAWGAANTAIAVRASIGLREFGGTEAPDTILRGADEKLYASKYARKLEQKHSTMEKLKL